MENMEQTDNSLAGRLILPGASVENKNHARLTNNRRDFLADTTATLGLGCPLAANKTNTGGRVHAGAGQSVRW